MSYFGRTWAPSSSARLQRDRVLFQPEYWQSLAVGAFPLALVLGLALVAVSGTRGILAGGETMSPEGWMLYAILRVRDGEPLYSDFNAYPYVITRYSPIYYLVAGYGARIAGLDLEATLIFARVLSAASTLASAAFILALARECGASRNAAAVGAALFLASFAAQPWAYTTRPDMLALAVTLGGLWLYARGPSDRAAVVAGLVLAAAAFVKQSYIIGAAALTFALLQHREWGRVVRFGSAYALAGASGLAVAELATGGLFSQNAISTNAVPWGIGFWRTSVTSLVLFSVPLGWLAWIGSTRSRGRPATRVMSWYAAGGLAFGLLAVGKAGAIHNYFIEAAAGLSVLGALGFDELRRTARAQSASSRAGTGRLVVACVTFACLTFGAAPLGAFLFAQTRIERDSTRLAATLRAVPGPVLTEQDSLAMLLADKPMVLSEVFEFALLGAEGRWDPAPLNEMIERGEFGLIVLKTSAETVAHWHGFAWWPPGSRERIQAHYQLVGQEGERFFYAPVGR